MVTVIKNFSWLHLRCDQLGFKISLIRNHSAFVIVKTQRIFHTFYIEIGNCFNNVAIPSELLDILEKGGSRD